jgi:hypothetical protein
MPTTSKPRRFSKVSHVLLSEIRPSPENDRLYRPIDPNDPEIVKLAESMRLHDVLEPLVVTEDGYILSGHRRYTAANVAGLKSVPARTVPIRRSDHINEFVRLLREYNRQRDKTNDERLREEIVTINPEDAHRSLVEYRRERAAVGVKSIALRDRQPRKAISSARRKFLLAVDRVTQERRDFWPLSDRQIHYALLNDPPLIHSRKPNSIYKNDVKSYKALTDLLTRARLDGSIPFEAIGDETRPVSVWNVYTNPRAFIREQLTELLGGYYRNLQAPQPCHIEIIGEKNTVASILRPVAAEYCIPMTTGRGYCSLPPRKAIADRFAASGKERLVLLIVSDFDPDGEEIAHSFARSMRDDFGIEILKAIKVALTAAQVEQYRLPPKMKAKTTSVNHDKFVSNFGDDVFELEALAPEDLQTILREHIESVIDRESYGAEIEAEKSDAAFLEGVRKRLFGSLASMGLDAGCESPS